MNIKKSSWLLSSLLFVLIMSGCGTNQNNSNPNTGKQPSTQETLSLPKTRSEADIAAFQGAQKLKDPAFCDKISDQEFIQECKTELSDSTALAEAINKMDNSECEKLSSADKKAACKIQVEVTKTEMQSLQQSQEKSRSAYSDLNKIIATGDYTQCKNIDSENLRDDCEYNILVNKALETKDISNCDKITNSESKTRCKDFVSTSLDTGSSATNSKK